MSDVDGFDMTTTVTDAGDEILEVPDDPCSLVCSFTANTFPATNPRGVRPTVIGVEIMIPVTITQSRSYSPSTVLTLGKSTPVTRRGISSIRFEYI